MERPKRGQGATIQSPPKPPSPNENDNSAAQPRKFWFKYVEGAIEKEGREILLHDDVDEEELGMSTTQRSRAETTDGAKRNFFVRDTVSGQILMVKLHTNIERSYKEWVINRKLKEYNVPHIIPALAWCKGRQVSQGDECAFLVLPFIKSVAVSLVPDSGNGALSDLQWLQGFKQMLEVFVYTDPEILGTSRIRLFHKDLNTGQILYEYRTNNWYLIDFGLSEVTYTGSLPGEIEPVKVTVTIRASSSFSNSAEEMTTLKNIFIERFESDTLAQYFRKIKTRDRDTWLNAVEIQIRNLSATTTNTTSTTTPF